MTFLETAVVVAWLIIAVQTLAIGGLIRQLRILAGAMPTQLRAGSVSSAHAPWVGDVTTMLVFLSAECAACKSLVPVLRGELAARAEREGFKLVAVSPGEVGHDLGTVTILENRPDLLNQFSVRVTPFGAVVEPGGRVRSTRAIGSPKQLTELLVEAEAVHRAQSIDLVPPEHSSKATHPLAAS